MHLPAIQTAHQRLALLSLDIVPQLAARFGLDLTVKTNELILEQLLQVYLRHLVPVASGVVLDPMYSYGLMNQDLRQTGILFRLEKLSTELNLQTLPTLIPNWGVEHIKNHYALAKLELWYHPAEKEALAKKQLIAELGDFCAHEGIGFLLKLQLPPLTAAAQNDLSAQAQFQTDQLTAAAELARSVSALSLQPPTDALSCATLTAEIDVPWIASLELEEGYEPLKEQLRLALDNGAQGFMIDDALWHEMYQLKAEDNHTPDWPAVEQFIATTARDRLIELTRITDESGVAA